MKESTEKGFEGEGEFFDHTGNIRRNGASLDLAGHIERYGHGNGRNVIDSKRRGAGQHDPGNPALQIQMPEARKYQT